MARELSDADARETAYMRAARSIEQTRRALHDDATLSSDDAAYVSEVMQTIVTLLRQRAQRAQGTTATARATATPEQKRALTITMQHAHQVSGERGRGPAQRRGLCATVWTYRDEHGHGPTLRELSTLTGLSQSVVLYHLHLLYVHGQVTWEAGPSGGMRPRTLRTTTQVTPSTTKGARP